MTWVNVLLMIIIIILAVILLLILILAIGFDIYCKSTDNLSYLCMILREKLKLPNLERQKILYEMFDKVISHTRNIEIFPIYGTLLGITREKGIICYDYDLDFAIESNNWEEMKLQMTKLCKEDPRYGYIRYEFPFMKFIQLYHKETMVNCDISVFERKGDSLVRNPLDFDNLKVEDFFPLKETYFMNKHTGKRYIIKIPNDNHAILTKYYGLNYHIPNYVCDHNCDNCEKRS